MNVRSWDLANHGEVTRRKAFGTLFRVFGVGEPNEILEKSCRRQATIEAMMRRPSSFTKLLDAFLYGSLGIKGYTCWLPF